MGSYMVIYTIVVDGVDTPEDAVAQAVTEVASSPADVWTVPDDLDDEPMLYRVAPPVTG